MALTPDEIALKYEVDLDLVEQAVANLEAKQAIFLTVSGKLGAGKDTIAPLITQALGFPSAEHEFFARPLKEEVNQVVAIIQEVRSLEEAILASNILLHTELSAEPVTAIYEAVKSGELTSAYDRTAEMRRALQLWGTEVRRSVDENYWVKKATQSAIAKIAEGISVYVTDSRFPNEADAIDDIGGMVVRIVVSPEEQRRRIMARDGIEPDPNAINHVSETSLDDYDFRISILTDNKSIEDVVAEALAKIARDGTVLEASLTNSARLDH